MAVYLLKGKRPGFVIDPDWNRIDQPDGYTEFRDRSGECKAVYLTQLLGANRHGTEER